jgi:hypothetical protein
MRAALALVGIVLAIAGCGGGAANGRESPSDKYAGLDQYEAQSAARRVASDESANADSLAYRKSLFAGTARRSRYIDGEDAAWRVELTTIDEQPTGLCVWVSGQGTDPINYDYVYELERCDAGSATD